ncbi:restriction endonuclease subunit S [Micrococcus luteus]|uniref:restriction endonuclease subunit S n=1 Tax=Micrococcus luteus TaxID=1270 RepID=UPI0009B811A0|nr:restriction endonuclease subunit S [Micrococcus luteus]MCM3553358.1 restriction endonuclease subunit S [Micrococcus luteus]MCV7507877.1 restriction endonuclease subunit S [Micrococcus luteus]MCV7547640.1 restriction endonuclease subunit S [Micrococcus luteus]MCV7702981.1 restriction endonuclease subunit S [Micrococcus luteus]MCV7705145.1 restriction endonuclease subunit S [Micrococcus luteus]
MSWTTKMLGDVVRLRRGYDLPTSERQDGPYPVLSAGHAIGSHIVPKVPGPGFAVGRATNLGRPVWSDTDFWPLNTTLYAEDFLGNEARWVYHLFETLDLSGYNSGSAQPMLNRNYIAKVPVLVPPLRVQQAIAEVLGALDDKIATNLEVASTLDEIGAIQFQKIAENSPRSPVGDVATLVLGGTPNRSVPEYWNGSVPWIASGACNQKIVTQPTEFITELGLERSAAKMLPAKTTVVAITGATLGKMGWLGSAMSANQSVVGVHAHSTPAWIYHALRSEQTQLMNWATGGAQQHVNKGAVAAIEVPFESNRAQVFEALIGPLMDRAVFAMQENATLTAVRDELLPQLMSGRITVKDAEKRVEEEV